MRMRKEIEIDNSELYEASVATEYEDPQTRAYREKYLALLRANTDLVEEHQQLEKDLEELKKAIKIIVKWL